MGRQPTVDWFTPAMELLVTPAALVTATQIVHLTYPLRSVVPQRVYAKRPTGSMLAPCPLDVPGSDASPRCSGVSRRRCYSSWLSPPSRRPSPQQQAVVEDQSYGARSFLRSPRPTEAAISGAGPSTISASRPTATRWTSRRIRSHVRPNSQGKRRLEPSRERQSEGRRVQPWLHGAVEPGPPDAVDERARPHAPSHGGRLRVPERRRQGDQHPLRRTPSRCEDGADVRGRLLRPLTGCDRNRRERSGLRPLRQRPGPRP